MVRSSVAEWPTRSLLFERADVTPDRTALVDPTTTTQWTYRELAADAGSTAARLGERSDDWDVGPESRPRVGYLLPPSSEFVTTLYALWYLGWSAVGLHTDLTSRELDAVAEIAGLDAIVTEAEFLSQTEAVDCPVVTVESLNGSVHPDKSSPTVEQPVPANWQPDETALVLFTSGTTEEPKGVRLTFRNLVASATASAFRLGVDPADRWLCCLPVSHMGGFAPAVRTVLYGTTLVVHREFDASETAAIIEDEGISEISLVPTQLKRLLDEEWTPPDSLDTVLLGGAPATDDLLDRAEDAGVPVYPTYGMTETTSQIATARPGERRQYPGTVGQPLVSTDVTILSRGTPSEPGEEGEIVVEGPTVTPGYLDAGQTADAFGEYGFHTGDVGYRDEAGRLWVVGRVDDLINTGGELVSPAEVVETLVSAEGVDDAAVVGIPDEEWGERVAALLVPNGETAPNEASLREVCRDQLAPYKIPKTLDVTAEIPRTASGTVDRDAVRERLGQ